MEGEAALVGEEFAEKVAVDAGEDAAAEVCGGDGGAVRRPHRGVESTWHADGLDLMDAWFPLPFTYLLIIIF